MFENSTHTKSEGNSTPIPRCKNPHRRRWRHILASLLIASTVGWGSQNLFRRAPHPPASSTTWTLPVGIPTSKPGQLSWWTCPDIPKYQCAYLDVPMNYDEPNGPLVSLFMRKLPGRVHTSWGNTVPPRGRSTPVAELGTLLINPGGPGVSGNAAVIDLGEKISKIVEGKYDIVGWDPRGVNMTLPPLDCYKASSHSMLYQLSMQHIGMPLEWSHSRQYGVQANQSSALSQTELQFMKRLDAYYAAPAKACEKSQMAKAVATSLVVRDMVEIVKALGEDGVSYWGLSYGTVLGALFAASHPNLVKRMVLDGVSDAIAYTTDYWEWGRKGLASANETVRGFFEMCWEAGEEGCAFAFNSSGYLDHHSSIADLETDVKAQHPDPAGGMAKGWEQLRYRFDQLSEALITNGPLPVASSRAGFGVFTASDLQLLLFEEMYHPSGWQRFAQGLADAYAHSNATILYETLYTYFTDIRDDTGRNTTDNPFGRHIDRYGSPLSTMAIMCSDRPPMNVSVGDEAGWEVYLNYVHELSTISPTGESWAMWQGFCRHWTVEPVERFESETWRTLHQTRFPMLFVSLTADPVTPLTAAERLVEAFGEDSARLLVQNGFGHTSFAQPSICTAKTIRAYLVEGIMPEKGRVCNSDNKLVFPKPGEKTEMAPVDSLDVELARLMDELGEAAHRFRGFGTRGIVRG